MLYLDQTFMVLFSLCYLTNIFGKGKRKKSYLYTTNHQFYKLYISNHYNTLQRIKFSHKIRLHLKLKKLSFFYITKASKSSELAAKIAASAGTKHAQKTNISCVNKVTLTDLSPRLKFPVRT